MAESNATQVILTDDGIKIINAQNTADNAASGVANLNDPNLMSVIEKQTETSQYAGLTSQYNVVLARAKDANVSTTDLTTAYTNLNAFMTAILTDTTKASDVNRDTYKSLTDTYNTALSNVQTALKDAYNTDIDNMQSSVSVASQTASSAAIVASQATTTGNNASQVASQAASAANQASADYTALSAGVKDGSVVHITTKTVIDDAVIGTAEIADAAITDAKIGNISANHLTIGTIDASKVTVANLDAGNITTGTLSTDRLNVGKLSALSANLGDVTTGTLKGVDIVANSFSTPNGSFTTDASGAITAKNMVLIGGTLTSPTINASTINGSTINGTTFNAGDIISSTYNTSRFYPTTITPAGLVATTGFNSMDGLRTEMSAGSFVTKYRAVHSSSNQYEAYDGVFSGDELVLNSGFTNGIDTGFQQSVSGNQLTGQVVLSPLNGIHLWGSTQSIHFSGLQMNGTGITFNSYGNIIADQASNWWRVTNFSGSNIASFGTDTAGSNAIQFNRDLWVSNMGLGTGHQIRSKDGHGIYFTDDSSHRVDTYHNNIYYSGSVSKSLLSEKTNVTAADVNYWSNLAMSIDLATYNYKTDDYTDPLRLSGIIDDVNSTKEWTLPEAFYARDEDGNIVGIDNGVLLNAVLALSQEQAKQIDKLNGHSMELEARLNKLEAKLNG